MPRGREEEGDVEEAEEARPRIEVRWREADVAGVGVVEATDVAVAVDTDVGRVPPDLEGGEGVITDRNKEAEREGRPLRPTGRGRGGGTTVTAVPRCRRTVPARWEGEGQKERRRRRERGGETAPEGRGGGEAAPVGEEGSGVGREEAAGDWGVGEAERWRWAAGGREREGENESRVRVAPGF
uniref:Uncharacterized protein n=2 Tax=Oryza glaberrima TaxID=4538 RepID=I1QWM3_ORYGL